MYLEAALRQEDAKIGATTISAYWARVQLPGRLEASGRGDRSLVLLELVASEHLTLVDVEGETRGGRRRWPI
jgi:hypothetical protein